MTSQYQNIDHTDQLEIFRTALSKADQGKGSIICVNGEQGFGKSHLLKSFFSELTSKKSDYFSAFVECQAPIGNFNISNLQPLYPFIKAQESILSNKKNLSRRVLYAGKTGRTSD